MLVAGAGIGGLTAALALLKRDFDVDVYEQAHELREIGAGLQLSANGNRVLYALGVGDELKRLACEATGKEVRLWSTGQTWKLFDLGAVSVARYGFPYFTVYRPDLLEILAQAVRREKSDAIHLGARCTGFAQDGNRVACGGNTLLERSKSEPIQSRYDAYTQEAIERQVFGAPTYFYRDEPFWGQDRLDFLQRALAR